MLATSPPRESIGGRKKHQLAAMERGISSYANLVQLDNLIHSEDYDGFSETEKDLIIEEFNAELTAYEKNQERVSTY